MTRFLLPIALSAVLAATHAQAQEAPVFTAPMVHPITSPDIDAAPKAARPGKARAAGTHLSLRDKTPRKQSQDIGDVFQQACLQGHGEPEAVADWALGHGFVTAPALSQELASKLGAPGEATAWGEATNVFAPSADDDTLLLISSGAPVKCAVMTRRPVDGAQLRSRMEALAAETTGQKAAPTPVMTLDLGPRNTPQAARLVGYKFVADDQTQTLVVAAPVAVGKGISFLALTLEDPPAAAAR